jgi:ribosomal protein S18 acetylase RimI-like enzyme
LTRIKDLFNRNKDTFFFLFDDELIGSIFYLHNYIQSLSVNRKYQRMGYGSMLTKFAINKILSSDHSEVVLKVMEGNIPALELFKEIGFEIIR